MVANENIPHPFGAHLLILDNLGLRAVEKIKYPILLAFCPAFFVAMKLTYLDMLASSRLESGNKILCHLG